MEDTRLVLHIGAAKTGTSAIQAFIRANLSFLDRNGFVVPSRLIKLRPEVTGEHVLGLQSLLNESQPTRLIDAFETLRENLPPEKSLLMSAENLSNLGNHVWFKDALRQYDTKVILYLRRQDDLLMSAWQQWHSKIRSDFDAWIIDALSQYGHWDRIITDWESVVGEGNVTARLFDPNAFAEGNLLRDFLDALGLDATSQEPEFEIGTVNPSLSDIITPLVAGNRDIFKDSHDGEFQNFITSVMGEHYTDKRKVSLISRAQREAIMRHYEGINQRVCRAYFPNRERLFAPIDHSRYQYLDPQEMMQKQLRFLTHLLYRVSKRSS